MLLEVAEPSLSRTDTFRSATSFICSPCAVADIGLRGLRRVSTNVIASSALAVRRTRPG